MGLDMYLNEHPAKNQEESLIELHYWRKHNALHSWFEEKYRELNPMFDGDFNLVDFYLTEDLLLELKGAIEAGTLTPREGFFFGPTDYDPTEYRDDDLRAVNQALERVRAGKVISYTAWW